MGLLQRREPAPLRYSHRGHRHHHPVYAERYLFGPLGIRDLLEDDAHGLPDTEGGLTWLPRISPASATSPSRRRVGGSPHPARGLGQRLDRALGDGHSTRERPAGLGLRLPVVGARGRSAPGRDCSRRVAMVASCCWSCPASTWSRSGTAGTSSIVRRSRRPSSSIGSCRRCVPTALRLRSSGVIPSRRSRRRRRAGAEAVATPGSSPPSRASFSICSRKSGWAIAISALARCSVPRNLSRAAPCSVTSQSMQCSGTVTRAPAGWRATMFDTTRPSRRRWSRARRRCPCRRARAARRR